MKRPFKFLLIILGALISLWFIARLTGMIQLYSIPTPSNEPTLKVGSWVWASSLSKPQRGKFACFKGFDPYLQQRAVYVYRVCGLPGDVVEIRNGVLYVNGQDADASLDLNYRFSIAKNNLENISDSLSLSENDMVQLGDSVLVMITKEEATKISGAKRVLHSPEYSDTDIERIYRHGWNPDWFGPLKIPQNKFFLLGDSRNNALDSRYRGLADQSDFVGGVLGK